MKNFVNFNKIESSMLETGKIGNNETRIILQRHQKFDRDTESSTAGHLTEDGVAEGCKESARRIEDIIESIPEEEREKLFFLILASDTVYAGKGARSLETAEIITEELLEKMEKYGINKENLLNYSRAYRESKKGEPRPAQKLREPLMFEESPEFVSFLKEKYPDNLDFWTAFEEDIEKEKRLELGAEGPEDMADRIEKFIRVLSRYSSLFHKTNPDSRLVIWCVSHYDTISPWFKKYVLKEETTEKYLPVEYGAGVSINLNKEGIVKVLIGGGEVNI